MDYFFPILNWSQTIGWPLAGLIIGAVLPPLFYRKRRALAIILNVAGFLFYLPLAPSLLVCLNLLLPRDWLMQLVSASFTQLLGLSVILSPILSFAAVEAFVLLLLHLLRRARAARQPQT